MCDLTVFPARLAGRRTTNRAVSAGRGFGDDCARTCTGRYGRGGVQGEQVGVKHGTDCNEPRSVLASKPARSCLQLVNQQAVGLKTYAVWRLLLANMEIKTAKVQRKKRRFAAIPRHFGSLIHH